jgi:hypothetical protein
VGRAHLYTKRSYNFTVFGAPASLIGSELPGLSCSGLYTVLGRALWTPPWRGLRFTWLCVARDFRRCDHDYPRWGGHIPGSIATSSVLGAPASIIGSELPQLPL